MTLSKQRLVLAAYIGIVVLLSGAALSTLFFTKSLPTANLSSEVFEPYNSMSRPEFSEGDLAFYGDDYTRSSFSQSGKYLFVSLKGSKILQPDRESPLREDLYKLVIFAESGKPIAISKDSDCGISHFAFKEKLYLACVAGDGTLIKQLNISTGELDDHWYLMGKVLQITESVGTIYFAGESALAILDSASGGMTDKHAQVVNLDVELVRQNDQVFAILARSFCQNETKTIAEIATENDFTNPRAPLFKNERKILDLIPEISSCWIDFNEQTGEAGYIREARPEEIGSQYVIASGVLDGGTISKKELEEEEFQAYFLKLPQMNRRYDKWLKLPSVDIEFNRNYERLRNSKTKELLIFPDDKDYLCDDLCRQEEYEKNRQDDPYVGG
jgi:hypothetical protein